MYIAPYPPPVPRFPSLVAMLVQRQTRDSKQAARDWFNSLPEEAQYCIARLHYESQDYSEEFEKGLLETIRLSSEKWKTP